MTGTQQVLSDPCMLQNKKHASAQAKAWSYDKGWRQRFRPCSASDNFTAELQELLQELLQAEREGCSIHQGHRIDGEAHLQRCELVQIV